MRARQVARVVPEHYLNRLLSTRFGQVWTSLDQVRVYMSSPEPEPEPRR